MSYGKGKGISDADWIAKINKNSKIAESVPVIKDDRVAVALDCLYLLLHSAETPIRFNEIREFAVMAGVVDVDDQWVVVNCVKAAEKEVHRIHADQRDHKANKTQNIKRSR